MQKKRSRLCIFCYYVQEFAKQKKVGFLFLYLFVFSEPTGFLFLTQIPFTTFYAKSAMPVNTQLRNEVQRKLIFNYELRSVKFIKFIFYCF
jgi:hypothetical protein